MSSSHDRPLEAVLLPLCLQVCLATPNPTPRHPRPRRRLRFRTSHPHGWQLRKALGGAATAAAHRTAVVAVAALALVAGVDHLLSRLGAVLDARPGGIHVQHVLPAAP